MGIKTKTVQIGDIPTKEALEEIERASKKEIRYDLDSPKLTALEVHEFVPANAELYKPKKEQITLKIDADVLAAFRRTGKGYQTKINQVLRTAVFGQ